MAKLLHPNRIALDGLMRNRGAALLPEVDGAELDEASRKILSFQLLRVIIFYFPRYPLRAQRHNMDWYLAQLVRTTKSGTQMLILSILSNSNSPRIRKYVFI